MAVYFPMLLPEKADAYTVAFYFACDDLSNTRELRPDVRDMFKQAFSVWCSQWDTNVVEQWQKLRSMTTSLTGSYLAQGTLIMNALETHHHVIDTPVFEQSL